MNDMGFDEAMTGDASDVEPTSFHKALMNRLDEGRRQLDQGEFVEFDKEGLRQLFEDLKVRARNRRDD